MHVLTRGVPHEGLADFLQYTCFHHSAVEGVPKIVEAVVANSRPADRRRPGRFDFVKWLAFEGKYKSFFFSL